MTEWRTIVTASGPVSHAWRGGGGAACGRHARIDSRAEATGDRRCRSCKNALAGEAARENAQEPLPFGPVSGANAAMAAAWKGGVR